MPDSPARVGVVIATYNRSNILRHAIESVRDSTLRDWQMIVVGDACTDDTASVVAAIADPRIRFVNLEQNFGEQSGPNNIGVSLLDTRYVAFLNHDDLFFADHLAACVERLDATGADLVFSAAIGLDAHSADDLAAGRVKARLLCATAQGRYQPYLSIPASCWVLKRELMDEMGGWTPARDCAIESSQNFLFRAWRAGKRLLPTEAVTVLALASGDRRNTYSERQQHEHDHFLEHMRSDPHYRERLLTAAALRHNSELLLANRKLGSLALTRLKFRVYEWLCRAGVHPRELRLRMRLGRGGWLRELRQRRGLPTA